MSQREVLSLLACPECKNEILLENESFSCPNCRRKYPLIDGIPVFGFNENETSWKEFFNDLSEKKGNSEDANAYFNKKSFEFTKSVLLHATGDLKGKKIVDIGCGTGHATSSFSKDNILIGVDISLKILIHAKNKGLHPVQSSATRLPLKSNSFEIIICNNLLQTVPEGEAVLDEIERITSKGGKVFIATLNREGIPNKLFSIIEREKNKRMKLYSMHEISFYLRKKNFKINSFYFLSLPLMKAWKNRESKFIKSISTSFLIVVEK